MSSVTVIHPATFLSAKASASRLDMQSAVRERCRQQLQKRCEELFDEVDDFLFVCGRNGQFAEDASYLKSMREMRSKQKLFEEAFLTITLATLFPASHVDGVTSYSKHLIDRNAQVFEMLEIDLALDGMERKATKIYAGFDNQAESYFNKFQQRSERTGARHFALVDASLWAFGEAQRVFAIPLEIRLVVIKLFEQHVLLKLEDLFIDIISILKNALSSGNKGVEFDTREEFAPQESGHTSLRQRRLSRALADLPDQDQHSARVDAAVETAVSEVCAHPKLPTSVSDLIRCNWRAVLFLIGSNRGCQSREWKEAMHTMEVLAACACDALQLQDAELKELMNQLQQGFTLLQMPKIQIEALLHVVRDILPIGITVTSFVKNELAAEAPRGRQIAETSVSPSGMAILDRDDLKDLANLLGSDERNIKSKGIEKELMEYLPEIDSLEEGTEVEYKIDGRYQTCSLARNPAKPGMYNITDRHSRITITRSRLGLAISLQGGELKIAKTELVTNPSGKTLFDPPAPKSCA